MVRPVDLVDKVGELGQEVVDCDGLTATLTHEEARKEKHRISLADIGRGNALSGSEQLPQGLNGIIERSLSLHQRVLKLDAMINIQAKSESSEQASHVDGHMARIAAVFKVGRA